MISVSKLEEQLRGVVADLEANEKTLEELRVLTLYCRGRVLEARRLEAPKLVQAWQDLATAVENSYRAGNIGLSVN